MRTLLIVLVLTVLTGCPEGKKAPAKKPPAPPHVPDVDLGTQMEVDPDPLDLDGPAKKTAKTAAKTAAETAKTAKTKPAQKTF